MALFSIDKTKCDKKGHCIDCCPMMIIRPGEDGFPEPADHAAKFCITCGHCVAVCPYDAFSHRRIDINDCPKIEPALTIGEKEAEQLFKSRRSTRRFKPEVPDRKVILELLDTARFAPSGKNTQPSKWIVLDNRESITNLIELVIQWAKEKETTDPEFYKSEGLKHLVTAWRYKKDIICYNAPCVIIAYSDSLPRRAIPAGTIALAHIELYCRILGLGACWAGILTFVINDFLPIKTFLGLSKGHQAIGSMLIGYPKYQFNRIPKRNEADITWK